jgi:hypothetical protein
MCVLAWASADSGEPEDDYIRVNIKGLLREGINGPTITARGLTWRLALSSEKLRQTAGVLKGKKVLIHGTLDVRLEDKRKQIVVTALAIQRAVHRIELIGKPDGTLQHIIWDDKAKLTNVDSLKAIVRGTKPTELVLEFDKALDREVAAKIQMEILSISGLPIKRFTLGPKKD